MYIMSDPGVLLSLQYFSKSSSLHIDLQPDFQSEGLPRLGRYDKLITICCFTYLRQQDNLIHTMYMYLLVPLVVHTYIHTYYY